MAAATSTITVSVKDTEILIKALNLLSEFVKATDYSCDFEVMELREKTKAFAEEFNRQKELKK